MADPPPVAAAPAAGVAAAAVAVAALSSSSPPQRQQPARVEDHLLAGTIAGLTSTGLLFPLDLIKTHYQVYDRAGRPYASLVQGMRTILRQEGYRGLYKGLSPALLANGVSWGGYFLFYEHAKNRYLVQQDSPKPLTSVHHLLAAFEAGIIMVFLTNPLWLIKTRMQLQPTPAAAAAAATAATGAKALPQQLQHQQQEAYRGLWHAVRTIVREEGPAGLYKGLFPALLLTSHGAIQFVAYEWLKRVAEPYHVPLLSFSVLGGVAKIVAGLATYPYQVIKARLQQRETGQARWRYAGTWDCIRKIWRYEGALGFFKGCVPNVLKTAPSAAITFVVYEEILKALNGYHSRRSGGKGPDPEPEPGEGRAGGGARRQAQASSAAAAMAPEARRGDR